MGFVMGNISIDRQLYHKSAGLDMFCIVSLHNPNILDVRTIYKSRRSNIYFRFSYTHIFSN